MAGVIPASIAAAGSRLWDGYYINLDRSPDRRRRTEEQLLRFGLTGRYERLAAVDGRALGRPSPLQPGEVGAFLSHLDALKKVAAGGRYAHIMEDDSVLCGLTAPTVEAAIRRGVLEDFDLLFLQTDLGNTFARIKTFHIMYEKLTQGGRRIVSPDQLQILDISQSYVYGLYSYVVGPKGLGRLIPFLERKWAEGPTLAVDMALGEEMKDGRLRVGCVFPFVTAPDFDSTRANATTHLANRDLVMVRPMLQYSFFADRDIGAATPVLDGILDRLGVDSSDETIEYYVKFLKLHLQLADLTADR